jgi:pyruvate ferredoxin oxidoreductase alpha subunit
MGARDTGFIQLYSENSQEAYDNTIQAVRIAEHPDVRTPVMLTLDGFIISHTVEALRVFKDEPVKDFVGEYKPLRTLLDTDNPLTIGPLDLPNYYFEHKRQQVEAINRSKDIIVDVGKEFEKISGRKYGLFESYQLDDAEVAIVLLGSTAGTAKDAVDSLRQEGVKAGLLKLRVFRPFPGKEIIQALSNAKAVGVFDRAISFGLEGGPLFHEVRSFAFGSDFRMASYIYGLGGRDITVAQIRDVFLGLKEMKDTGRADTPIQYIGLRE